MYESHSLTSLVPLVHVLNPFSAQKGAAAPNGTTARENGQIPAFFYSDEQCH